MMYLDVSGLWLLRLALNDLSLLTERRADPFRPVEALDERLDTKTQHRSKTMWRCKNVYLN